MLKLLSSNSARDLRLRAPYLGLAGVLVALPACGAVYPELSTPVRTAPSHVNLVPTPPEDLLFVKFRGAVIPTRTRDGRKWDSVGGSLPDAFAKLFVDGRELVLTPVQSNTLTPTWPDQRIANYRIRLGAAVRVELWDSNPINNHPICVSEVRSLHAESASDSPLKIDCDSGAEITLEVDPAHSRLGVGMYYELRREEVVVTRVLRESPAGRAGLSRGDQLLKIQDKPVKTMSDGEAQSLINANAATGVKLWVRKVDRTEAEVELKEGPIYPVADEDIRVDG